MNGGHRVSTGVIRCQSRLPFCQPFLRRLRLADALDADIVLGGEHAGTGACGRAYGERERRGRPVDHAASHELQDDVAVVIDVALLDVVEETVLLERFLPRTFLSYKAPQQNFRVYI